MGSVVKKDHGAKDVIHGIHVVHAVVIPDYLPQVAAASTDQAIIAVIIELAGYGKSNPADPETLVKLEVPPQE